MWHFVSKLWPRESPDAARESAADTAQRHAQLGADAFARNWRTSLGVALGRLLGRVVHPFEAPAALAALDARCFGALDQRLRVRAWDSDLQRSWRGAIVLPPIAGTEQERDAYLLTAACDGNGHIREQALIAFAQYPSRLALVAALLRCDDWVEQVAGTARVLLDHLLSGTQRTELFSLLDLVLALNQRQRFAHGVWRSTIEPVLVDPAQAQQRRAASRSGTPRARLFALNLIARCDGDSLDAVCGEALHSDDPSIARWALALAAAADSRRFALELATKGLRHANGSVRTAALRLATTLDAPAARSLVEAALFDPAQAPRAAAAYELRTRYAGNALDRWRAALDDPRDTRRRIAVEALADCAEPQDIARLLPWRDDARVRTRAAVLRGLHRARADDFARHFAAAVHERSPVVIRAALLIAKSEPGLLDRALLIDAFDAATNVRARRALVRAARGLGRWPALALYARWAGSSDETVAHELQAELRRWQAASARQFTPLTADTKRDIEQWFGNLRWVVSAQFLEDLRHALAHA